MTPSRLRVAYDTVAALAADLADAWEINGRVAQILPYDRFHWEQNKTIWVLPARDTVGFRYGKIVVSVSQTLVDEGGVFIGLEVEKGIGPALAAAGFYPQNWVMEPSWRWHAFVSGLAADGFRDPIAQAARGLAKPVRVQVDAHVPLLAGAVESGLDVVRFDTNDGVALTMVERPSLVTQQQFLRNAVGAASLQHLASALKTIPEPESVWVRLFFGQAFQKTGFHDPEALDATQVSRRLLEPFAPWVA